MENIMNELIQIENSANEFIKRADEEKKKLPGRISLRAFELEKVLDEETKNKLRDIKEKTDAQTVKDVEELRLANEKKIEGINAEFQANKADWVNNILNNILNG